MSVAELYIAKRPIVFTGVEGDKNRALFHIIGVPLDTSASYRSGQRFAPLFVREASVNIESNAYAIEGFIEQIPIYDEGDLIVAHGDVSESLDRLSVIVEELAREERRLVLIGGEHIITLGAVKGLKKAGYKPCFIVLDAHLDLRSDYLGVRLSHACVMRRILESIPETKAAYIGVRAYSLEELDYAKGKPSIHMIQTRSFELLGVANVGAIVRRHLEDCQHIYLTIDMDVYDPSYAPGVGNPEPAGLSPREILPLLASLIDERVIAIDLVEVAPPFDVGNITSILAAKTLQEAIIAAGLAMHRASRTTKP